MHPTSIRRSRGCVQDCCIPSSCNPTVRSHTQRQAMLLAYSCCHSDLPMRTCLTVCRLVSQPAHTAAAQSQGAGCSAGAMSSIYNLEPPTRGKVQIMSLSLTPCLVVLSLSHIPAPTRLPPSLLVWCETVRQKQEGQMQVMRFTGWQIPGHCT